MGAKIAGFLATLMLSIPLAAIGLMAVFGIPQLVPANGGPTSAKDTVIRGVRDAFNWGNPADPQPEQVSRSMEDAPHFGDTEPVSHSPDSRDTGSPFADGSYSGRPQMGGFPSGARLADERYASNVLNSTPDRAFDSTPARSSGSHRDASSRGPFANSQASTQPPRHWSETPGMRVDPATTSAALRDPSGSFARPDFNSPTTRTSTSLEQDPSAEKLGQAALLTWRQASLRLTELGVKNYHLERGAAEGTFLFVCLFSPGDAPHVVHRFEAEADDPLIAVNRTLQQVDNWMRSRYAAANFPSKTPSMSATSGSQLR